MPKMLDISDEFQVTRYAGGIKLARPDQLIKPHSKGAHTGYSVQKILQLPFSIYFLNTQSELQKANRVLYEETALSTEKDCLGKTAHKITSAKFAEKLIRNDRAVLLNKKVTMIEEIGARKDGLDIHALSIKIPWYDQNNNLLGLMGFSVILKINSITEFLTTMSELRLLNNLHHIHHLHTIPTHITLSPREKEVLEHVLRGLPAKRIGVLLNISPRTVEYHIENMKAKFSVYSKSELIEKCIRK
jgi:DNA-binding CsgD family transcriptional regulator